VRQAGTVRPRYRGRETDMSDQAAVAEVTTEPAAEPVTTVPGTTVPGTTVPGTTVPAPSAAPVTVADVLVEEVSIDGMCGVY
jgi:mycofactocin precursor